jgi:putative toxin-antitoxin system antitoxin component (TIGR02293 family)
VNVQARDVAKQLGGAKVLGREVRDYGDLDALVEAGLPAESVRSLVHSLGEFASSQNSETLVQQVLSGVLAGAAPSAEDSRIIERLARLISEAEAAFGAREAAIEFVTAPHDRLGKKRPVDCLGSELVLKQVEQVLDSIMFGLPA